MSAAVQPHSPWRILTVATWQQAALTFVRFGIPALAPFLRADFQLSLTQTGLVLGAFNVGAFITFYPTGRATERFGEARVMALGAAAVAMLCAFTVIAHSWVYIALGLALAGVGFPSSQIAGSRAVYRAFSRSRRGLAMGIRQAGLPLGGLLAAVALPWMAARGGWQAAFLLAAGVALSGGVLCMLLAAPGAKAAPSEPAPARSERAVGVFFSRPDLLVITLMATLLAFGQFCVMSYMPLYLVDDFHIGKAGAALSLIGVQIGGIVGRLLWGFVSDRWAHGNRTGTLVAIALAGGAVAAALTLPSLAAVFALSFAAGLTLLGWNGLYVTLFSEHAGQRGATMLSLSMMVLYIAAMLAPPAFGQLIEWCGYRWAWAALLLPQAGAAALAIWVSRRAAPRRA